MYNIDNAFNDLATSSVRQSKAKIIVHQADALGVVTAKDYTDSLISIDYKHDNPSLLGGFSAKSAELKMLASGIQDIDMQEATADIYLGYEPENNVGIEHVDSLVVDSVVPQYTYTATELMDAEALWYSTSEEVPTKTDYLWKREQVTYSDASIRYTEPRLQPLNDGLIPMGTYKADIESFEIDKVSGTARFIMYDDALKFDKIFNADLLPDTFTGAELVAEACRQAGHEPYDFPATLPLNDYIYSKSVIFSELLSIRKAISLLAQANLATAYIDRDRVLRFKTVFEQSNPDFSVEPSQYTELTVDTTQKPIDGIEITLLDAETKVIPQALLGVTTYNPIRLSDNVFLEEEAELKATTLYITASGYTYIPFDLNWFAIPYVDMLDEVELISKEGQVYGSHVQSISLKFTGGLRGQLKTEMIEESGTEYVLSGRDQVLYNAIKKQEKAIKAGTTNYANGMADLYSSLSLMAGLYPSEEVLDDGSVMYYWHEQPLLADSQIIYRLSAGGAGVSTDSGLTWSGIDSLNDTIVAKILSVSQIQADQVLLETSNLSTYATTNASKVSSLETSLTTVEGTLGTVSSDLSTVSSDLNTAKTNLATNTNDLLIVRDDVATLSAQQLTFSTQLTDLETRIGAESRLIIEDIIPSTPYRVNDYWIPAKQTNAMLAGYTNKQLFDAGTTNLELFGQISYFSIKGRDSTESWNRTDWQASTIDGEPILTSIQRDMSELSSSHLLIKSDLEQTTTKTNTNSTDIATLTAKQLTLESDLSTVSSTASTASTKVTKIEAGNITLNSNTNGTIAGMSITSSTLRATSGSYGVQISGNSASTPIWVGNSSFTTPVFKVDWSGKMTANNADITGKITATSGKIGEWNINKNYIDSRSGLSRIYLANYNEPSSYLISIENSSGTRQFGVDKQGHLVANSASIKGTIQAGSVINGSLSNTTGTHTGGTTGTHSGSLSNTTGTHTGGTTGTHSGGLRYTTGSHAGTLYGTTGNHNGSIYSSTGSLGGVPFKTYTGANTLQLQGHLNMYQRRISSVASLGVGLVNAQTVNYEFLVKTSDINLKQDIVDIPESAVDDLMRLDIKEFSYKDTPKKRHYGVIAQDVLRDTSREFSDIMVKPQDGYFTVSYESLVPVLVKTVQEQDKRIRELEEKIA